MKINCPNYKNLKLFFTIVWLAILANFLSIPLGHADELIIKIKGLKEDALTNANLAFDVEKKINGKILTLVQVQHLYHRGPEIINKAIQPFGFFKSKTVGTLTVHNKQWLATFYVQPGPGIKISSIQLAVTGAGEYDKKLQKVVADFPVHTGEIFHTKTYENAKVNLLNQVKNLGFIKAAFVNKKIFIDLSHYEVKITLLLDTNERYYFGKFLFKKGEYDEGFLHRFIPYSSNDAFSSDQLLQLQQDMGGSAYFRNITLFPDFAHIYHHQIPVKVSYNLPSPRRYTLGLGYGTLTGPRISTGVNFRRITNTGQHLDAQLSLSKVLSGIGVKYYIPGYNPLTEQWTIGLTAQEFLPKNGRSISANLSGAYSKKTGHITQIFTLNNLIERYQITTYPYVNSRELYPSYNISYVETNDPITPQWGRSLSMNLQAGSKLLLSNSNFTQGEIKGKYLTTPVSFARFIARGDVGYTVVEDLTYFPFSLRYFAGGMNSIRGFADSSIGPGKYLEVGSAEYQNKIINQFWGAIFYDVGKATNTWNTPFSRGAGVGLVYYSFVGPIKIYVARALSNPQHPKSIEFSMGPEF